MKKKKDNPPSLSESASAKKIIPLGESIYSPEIFPSVDEVIKTFRDPGFLKITIRKRFRQINQTLTELIQKAPSPAFLLSSVLDFFDRINSAMVLNNPLNLNVYEFWLNHFSGLSEAENYEIRAKIIGKYLPREDYQAFFPIGMGKAYFGSHFVTAHLSPDVDTMIASFWGWADAFGARVGSGLHQWCLPGGPPDSPVTSVFRSMFGPGLFPSIARTNSSLTLAGIDLVTQKHLTKEPGSTIISSIHQDSNEKAIVLVSEQGHYLGDWQSSDIEPVWQILNLFKSCLHWFENNLHTHLISLFAKADLSIRDLGPFNASIFDIQIKNCDPARDFKENQQTHLNHFFKRVLEIEKGSEGTFRDLNEALFRLSVGGMLNFQREIEENLLHSNLFNEKGILKENRSEIFDYLKKLIKQLDRAIYEVRIYVERLDVVLGVKYKVLGRPYHYVTLQSDVDEMRQKIEDHDFLTVVIHETDGSLFPVGIIPARDLREQALGTVSLRDFCNLEEVRMAGYLEVISVIDHHKSSLKTPSVPTAIIGDAQSCNVLIAEQMFILNDKYSLGGMTEKEIDEQIGQISSDLSTASQMRILQRLLQRKQAIHQASRFYIHPKREFTEYLCFLHAILDDTDLLTKVSKRDLACVAELLNRLKSLLLRSEVEIIHFDDIPEDKQFVKAATKRVLQQSDMYSLYKQIYSLREAEVEAHLNFSVQGCASNIFLDTKEQNGCARVGQTKMFASNFPFFLKHSPIIRRDWLNQSEEIYREKPEIDLYIHMISTIPSAEEVLKNQMSSYEHLDELWFWTAPTEQGFRHLNSFLAGFQQSVKDLKETLSIEFLDSPPQKFIEVFNNHFSDISKKNAKSTAHTPMAILRFKAGALNSRKSMISPYLPRLP